MSIEWRLEKNSEYLFQSNYFNWFLFYTLLITVFNQYKHLENLYRFVVEIRRFLL